MVQEYSEKNDSPVSGLFILFIVGMFVSFPAMIFLMACKILREEDYLADFKCRYFLYFCLGTCMGLLNTTKPPEYSDLGYYYWLYERMGRISFDEFMASLPREPLFHIYTLIGHYLTFGNFKLYLVLTTILMYMPIMVGYDILVRKLELDIESSVLGSVILLLFPQYFFYTAQIVRQVLAGSLAFYCIVKSLYTGNKYATAGVFLAGFIHASAFIFSIYYLFNYTNKLKTFWKVGSFLLFALGFSVIMRFLASTGDDQSTLAYAARRGLSGSEEMVSVGLIPRLISLSIIPLGLFATRRMQDRRFIILFGVACALAGVILLNWNSTLMVLRFMEYTYIFLPIMCVLTLAVLNKIKIIYLLCLFMCIYFLTALPAGDFTYIGIGSFLMNGGLWYLV